MKAVPMHHVVIATQVTVHQHLVAIVLIAVPIIALLDVLTAIHVALVMPMLQLVAVLHVVHVALFNFNITEKLI
jgi:hypothetical protein